MRYRNWAAYTEASQTETPRQHIQAADEVEGGRGTNEMEGGGADTCTHSHTHTHTHIDI